MITRMLALAGVATTLFMRHGKRPESEESTEEQLAPVGAAH
jgi:hypothetical protein